MPSRICLACAKRHHWYNWPVGTPLKACPCGGRLVHLSEHPATVGPWLEAERRHLKELQGARGHYADGEYAAEVFDRAITRSEAKIRRMEALKPPETE